MDIFGPTKSIFLAMVMIAVGLLLLGLSGRMDFAGLQIGSILIGCGGGLSFALSFLCGFIVEKEYVSSYYAATNCLFDASTAVFFFVYQIYRAGISRKTIFVVFSILCAAVYLVLIYLWSLYEGELISVKKKFVDSAATPSEGEVGVRGVESAEIERGLRKSRADSRIRKLSANFSADADERNDSYAGSFKKLDWVQQIKSKQFLFLAIYLSINIFRVNTYMGIAANILESYGDESTGDTYTQVFSVVLPLGFLFIPFIDVIIRRAGFVDSFHFVSLLAMLFTAASMIPILPVQIVTFLSFCAYRAFFYSVSSAFTASTFGPVNVGRIYGFSIMLACFMNFLSWPAQVLTVKYANGDYFYLTLFMFLLLLPQGLVTTCVLKPLFQSKKCEEISQM